MGGGAQMSKNCVRQLNHCSKWPTSVLWISVLIIDIVLIVVLVSFDIIEYSMASIDI